MRAIWSGLLSVGVVSVPVKLYTATEDKDVHFHQLHDGCTGRVRYRKVCDECAAELEEGDIVKGYEYAKDQYVRLAAGTFDDLPVPSKQTVALDQFIALAEVDPIYFRKTYYLQAAKGGDHAYRLLHAAMVKAKRAAIGCVTLRDKESQAVVRPYGRILALTTLYDADEVRLADELAPEATHDNPKELTYAVELVRALTEALDISKHHDAYREALLERVTSLINGQVVKAATKEPSKPQPNSDLIAALQASIEKAPKQRRKAS